MGFVLHALGGHILVGYIVYALCTKLYALVRLSENVSMGGEINACDDRSEQ